MGNWWRDGWIRLVIEIDAQGDEMQGVFSLSDLGIACNPWIFY